MKTVLLVEDDRDLLRLYQIVLRQSGFEVTIAHDVVHALIELGNNVYDLVITDMHMPDQSGTAVVDALKADTRHAQTKIMVMTANAESLPEVEQRGVEHVMIKPFTIVDFANKVKSIFG